MIEVSHFLISQEIGYQVIFSNTNTGRATYLICPFDENLGLFKDTNLPIAEIETI